MGLYYFFSRGKYFPCFLDHDEGDVSEFMDYGAGICSTLFSREVLGHLTFLLPTPLASKFRHLKQRPFL